MGLVAARTVCQTSLASLTRPFAELAGPRLVDAVVSGRADVHARVAQEVHPSVALEALLASFLALQATRVALRADVVQWEIV